METLQVGKTVLVFEIYSLICVRFLGKWISQYLSEGVDTGDLRSTVIENGLDYDRWKITFSKIKNVTESFASDCCRCNLTHSTQPPQVPFPFDDRSDPLPNKECLVTALIDQIRASLKDWSDHALSDLAHLCVTNHKQFLELKVCRPCLEFTSFNCTTIEPG